MQMFVQIQFNHITTQNAFMITVQRVKNETFVFQTVQSGTVFTLFYTRLQ